MNDRLISSHSEVVQYWRGVLATLSERGLIADRQDGEPIVPHATGLVFSEYVAFILDMHRLAGIRREDWLDEKLWAQVRATLQGRRCFVADSAGLALVVAREPTLESRRLPRVIHLDLDHLPAGDYTITFGEGKFGMVTLELADENRSILIGGTSGGGKTNLMQAIILQLAKKHSPHEVQFAIVDPKMVDFGTAFARMPHLFQPIANNSDDAARLIEAVEQERLRRMALMYDAGVNDWRKMRRVGNPLPLLVLVVDEAADFAGTGTMKTLIEVARLGRAMGISVVVGTQHPTSKTVDSQVKANLPTAIAFQTRTHSESNVILGRSGAEGLRRKGLALSFLDGRWQRVQTPLVDVDHLPNLGGIAPPPRPALSDDEAALVRYAVEALDGAFIINRLYEARVSGISKRALTELAQQWEMRGWLTAPAHATDPRRVTDELAALCPTLGPKSGDRVTGVAGGDRDPEMVTGC